jgi:hypothetical protein
MPALARMATADELAPDEAAALDAIADFIRDCLADPEVIEELVLDRVRADARAALDTRLAKNHRARRGPRQRLA